MMSLYYMYMLLNGCIMSNSFLNFMAFFPMFSVKDLLSKYLFLIMKIKM